MVKRLLHQTNKKGISEIVSYTLLIIIAVSVSILVFAYLKVYVPKFQAPECPPDVNIVIKDITCLDTTLEFTATNKGLFNISAIYIRLRPPGREIKSVLRTNEYNEFTVPLSPGASNTITSIVELEGTVGEYELEVQPAAFNENGELAICESSASRQKVPCQIPAP
jgi:hypothetical protein